MKYKAKHTSYNLNLLLKSQIGRAFVGTKMRGDTVEGNLEIIKSVSSFAKFAASLFILQTRKKHNSEFSQKETRDVFVRNTMPPNAPLFCCC